MIFGDPPYEIGMEIGDPPDLNEPWFRDTHHLPLLAVNSNLLNKPKKAKQRKHENSE